MLDLARETLGTQPILTNFLAIGIRRRKGVDGS